MVKNNFPIKDFCRLNISITSVPLKRNDLNISY